MRAKDAVGQHGESIAVRQLTEQGWTVLDRNWRCSLGEIDIVARAPEGELVIIEVKTRRSDAFGHPSEAITRAKLTRLRVLTWAWLEAHPQPGPVRIDVMAVLVPPSGSARIDHLTGVGER